MNNYHPIILSVDEVVALSNQHLRDFVKVDSYDYDPCYLWYDNPLYNEFGDKVVQLHGNTIYLNKHSKTPVRDLFHELGHAVNRVCDLVGNTENNYKGCWDQQNSQLIAQISAQRHWSSYLNLFSLNDENFKANAASEVWAELFMIWHLYPETTEASLIDETMDWLEHEAICIAIHQLGSDLKLTRLTSTFV